MRFVKPVVAALALSVATMTFVDTADAKKRRYYRDYDRSSFSLSFNFGGYSPYRSGYYYAPRYYHAPRYYAQPRYYHPPPVYYRSSGSDWYSYCSRKYRSFNPHTGMFRGYDGRWHRCR